MEKQFPKTDKAVLGLVQRMLEFNPVFRPTANELLKDKLFDSIRIAELE